HCAGVLVFGVSRRIVWNQTIVDRGAHISPRGELTAETRHLALVPEQEAATMDRDHYGALPSRCRGVRLIQIKEQRPLSEFRLAHFAAPELKITEDFDFELRVLEKRSRRGGRGGDRKNKKT